MTRLKTLLLAGTILPALSLSPFTSASAQAPDQGERHGPRQHEGGGPKGEGKGEGHGPQQGAERRQGGPAHEKAQHENAQGAPAGGPKARAAEEGPRGEGKRHAQGAEKERPNRAEGPRADEPRGGRKAADEGSKAAPAGRAAQNPDERKERRETNRDRDNNAGPRNGARENAQTDRAKGPRDNEPRGGERTRAGDRDDRARDNRERAGERGPGDKMRAGERDDRMRDNRERAGDHDRDDRTRAGERDDRTRDNRDRAEDRREGDRPRAGERDERLRPGERDERRMGGPAGAASPGFATGFMAPTQARRLDDVRRDRREVREGDRVFIREPGRTIVQERGRAFIVHDENDRFRALGMNVRREQRGGQTVDVVVRPGGEQILTYTDGSGRMLRRVRRTRDGREIVIIDNAVGGRIGPYAEDVVALPPPPLRIPRDRYVVDYAAVGPGLIYDTLVAPPLAAPPRRYTLDQIRYSPDVRNYVRSVDINTINFDSGSWEVPAAATGKLEGLASAINKAVDRNPNSVFLIEGYTDATGNPDDNLSLSDRRAQSVAEILTKDFKVPPENLTTQGYGQQNLKENTQGPSEVNRRVVVRNITQLLAAGDEPPPAH